MRRPEADVIGAARGADEPDGGLAASTHATQIEMGLLIKQLGRREVNITSVLMIKRVVRRHIISTRFENYLTFQQGCCLIIQNLYFAALSDENVRWFNVAMNDAFLMRCFQSMENL